MEILVASISQSTLKQYESSLRQWWLFCETEGHNFYKPDRNVIIRFLTKCFKDGASYSSLNTMRSAISLISINKIGDDLLISRFFRGVFKLRPSRPKYTQTWDVSIVLSYLRSLVPLQGLALSDLTEKTVMLLALATAHRAQTLGNIKIDNIMFTSKGAEIMIPDLIKTSGPGRFQPLLVLPNFDEDKDICVTTSLKRYIEVTSKIRKDENKLFIAVRKPFKAVGSQSISRWIKIVLEKSGIDVSQFKSHSTRHASTSAALLKGIDLSTIRRTAGWSDNSQTFAHFYNRPILSSNEAFARAVLEK